jgi:hypothetical protein
MNVQYGLTMTSPEVVTSDRATSAATLKVLADTMTVLLSWGLFDPQSIADAMVTLMDEHADVKIVALTPEEREAQAAAQRAQQAEAQPPTTPEDDDDA